MTTEALTPLRRYGQHDLDCLSRGGERRYVRQHPCSCGLADALDAERAIRQEAADTSGHGSWADCKCRTIRDHEANVAASKEAADTSGLWEVAADVVARFDRVMHQPEGVWELDDEAAIERLRAALRGATERPLDVDALIRAGMWYDAETNESIAHGTLDEVAARLASPTTTTETEG